MSIYNLIWFFFDFQNLLWNVILKIVHKRWKNKVLSNISSHLNISLHVCQDSSWNNCWNSNICVIYKQSYQFSKYLFWLKNQIWIIQRKKNPSSLHTVIRRCIFAKHGNCNTCISLHLYTVFFSTFNLVHFCLRTFLSLAVSAPGDVLQKYTRAVDECFEEYKLPKYYEVLVHQDSTETLHFFYIPWIAVNFKYACIDLHSYDIF